MAISSNPTKTRTIENNWLRDINRRWAAFEKSAVDQLRRLNAQEVAIEPITNKGAVFDISTSQLRVYMAFLQREITRLLMVTAEPPNWQATYQAQAYQRGLDNARINLAQQGASLIPTAQEVAAASELTPFTATSTLGTTISSGAPIHQDALEFLFTRSYEKLDGWTSAMATETRQILFDGVAQGDGIDDVVRKMVARIDVSRTRSRVIARTETIQAFQISTTNEATRASEEIGAPVLLRWLTVRDERVRHLHANWHGTLATPKQNRARINVSPWNCRCGQGPVIPEANTEKKQKKFDKERKQLLRLERR